MIPFTPGKLLEFCVKILNSFINKPKAAETSDSMIVFFVFYVDLISGLFSWDFSHILFCWKAEEPHNCFGGVVSRYVYCKEEFGFGS